MPNTPTYVGTWTFTGGDGGGKMGLSLFPKRALSISFFQEIERPD